MPFEAYFGLFSYINFIAKKSGDLLLFCAMKILHHGSKKSRSSQRRYKEKWLVNCLENDRNLQLFFYVQLPQYEHGLDKANRKSLRSIDIIALTN
jgi:hypothetical protein